MVARGGAQRNPWNAKQRMRWKPREGRQMLAPLTGLDEIADRFQGLRCAPPLATVGRRSAAGTRRALITT
jgi:hypothetical protein